MKTWVKAILVGIAGAILGALLGVAGMFVWFFWLSLPTFKNDSEAMGFGVILIIFGALFAGGGATIGAAVGSAMVWCRARRYKVAAAIIGIGGAIFAWFLEYPIGAIVLLLSATAWTIWDLATKRASANQLLEASNT